MEKRRRARINDCLGQLKGLLTEALHRDAGQTSKLEKADILEMTVHLLRSLERHHLALAAQLSPRVLHRFQAGWSECQSQVLHFASSVEGFDPLMRGRLLGHLNQCLGGIAATKAALEGPPSSLLSPPTSVLGRKRPPSPDAPDGAAKRPNVWRPW